MTDTFYLDEDEDGFGNAEMSMDACESPLGYVQNANDCDDTNPSTYPGGIGNL